MAIAWLPGPAGTRRRVAKPSVEEPDAAEPARPDLWGARVSNDPGLPDRLDDLARVIRLIGLRRLLSPLVAGVVVGAVYLALAAGLLWDVGGLLVGLGVVLVLAVGGWRRMRYPRREGGSRADLIGRPHVESRTYSDTCQITARRWPGDLTP